MNIVEIKCGPVTWWDLSRIRTACKSDSIVLRSRKPGHIEIVTPNENVTAMARTSAHFECIIYEGYKVHLKMPMARLLENQRSVLRRRIEECESLAVYIDYGGYIYFDCKIMRF